MIFSQKAALGQRIAASALTLYEFQRVTLRKEMEGSLAFATGETLLDQLRESVESGQIELVPFNNLLAAEFRRVMLHCYRQEPPLPIRTLDALHLAAALVATEREMVVTDLRLREAARLQGPDLFP